MGDDAVENPLVALGTTVGLTFAVIVLSFFKRTNSLFFGIATT